MRATRACVQQTRQGRHGARGSDQRTVLKRCRGSDTAACEDSGSSMCESTRYALSTHRLGGLAWLLCATLATCQSRPSPVARLLRRREYNHVHTSGSFLACWPGRVGSACGAYAPTLRRRFPWRHACWWPAHRQRWFDPRRTSRCAVPVAADSAWQRARLVLQQTAQHCAFGSSVATGRAHSWEQEPSG
jgi:hypothetical protein